MSATEDLLEGVETIVGAMRKVWPVYYWQVEANAAPSMAAGDGRRGSDVSDPTGAAMLAAQPHRDARRQLAADIVGLFHLVKRLERQMLEVVNEPKKMSDRERERARCKGARCSAWAGEGRAGHCDSCWREMRTAQRAEQRARKNAAEIDESH